MVTRVRLGAAGRLLFALTLALAACGGAEPDTQMANPASRHCEQQGGRVEIVDDAEGGQRGVCVFPDGSRCDEWAFFRGTCGPGDRRS